MCRHESLAIDYAGGVWAAYMRDTDALWCKARCLICGGDIPDRIPIGGASCFPEYKIDLCVDIGVAHVVGSEADKATAAWERRMLSWYGHA